MTKKELEKIRKRKHIFPQGEAVEFDVPHMIVGKNKKDDSESIVMILLGNLRKLLKVEENKIKELEKEVERLNELIHWAVNELDSSESYSVNAKNVRDELDSGRTQ